MAEDMKNQETPDTSEEVKEEQTTPEEENISPEEVASEETAEAAGEETSGETSADDAEETEEADGSDEQEASPEKKSFFGKKNKKDKKDQKIEELTDRLQRSMAEFDNFRKRTEKEKASMYVIGAKEIVEKMLPIVDNFERGLDAAQEGDAFADGMKMVYKQLMTALDELGVQAIEAVGQPFDPNLHNAVMHVEDPEAGENVVVEEFQKGYTYKDFVVRHSMVKVAN